MAKKASKKSAKVAKKAGAKAIVVKGAKLRKTVQDATSMKMARAARRKDVKKLSLATG